MKTLICSMLCVLLLSGCFTRIGISDISGHEGCKAGFPLTGKVTTEGMVEYGPTDSVSDKEAQDETPAL